MNKLILALALTGFTSTAAFAQDVTFAAVDADQSGVVSIEEANAAGLPWTPEQFAKADLDSDGGLNEEEFKAAMQ